MLEMKCVICFLCFPSGYEYLLAFLYMTSVVENPCCDVIRSPEFTV